MAKKAAKEEVKKATKKVVKKAKKATKKVVVEETVTKSIYDLVLCHINCYGAYVLAVGAGCMFGVNNWVALGLLAITSGWAYWNRACKPCNVKTKCCGKKDCEK
jgi:hypothetical protein